MPSQSSSSVPPPIVALATWVVPGSGYWLIGQRGRALTVGITIVILFILGMLIGGVRVVEVPNGVLSTPVNAVSQKPWFVGQILAGPITLIASSIGHDDAYYASHSRVNEIGTLYTAVAGMLNLLAIIDAAYRAGHNGGTT
jgi:hypothetical protein